MSKKYTPDGWPDNIGSRGRLKDPDGSIRGYTIADEIRKQETAAKNKVIYLQLIKFDSGKQQLRLCYYIIGKVGRAKGKWVFGQFATLIPPSDFQAITIDAKSKGWFTEK